MSRYISKLFQPDKPAEQPKNKRPQPHYDNKKLPPDFAEQILVHDIMLDLSEYTSKDSLHALVQLYMKGVEYYESLQDERQNYFKKKLQWLMSHPKILQQNQEKTKQQGAAIQAQGKAPAPKVQPKPQIVDQAIYFQSHMPTIQSVMRDDESVCQFPEELETKKQLSNSKVVVVEDGANLMEEIVHQNMKQELFLQNEKKQAKELVDNYRRESLKIQQFISDEFVIQEQKITSRLRQRSSRRFSMNRASSQPVFQRFGFGHEKAIMDMMETEGDIKEIKEDHYESSQAVSRRPSNHELINLPS